MTPNPPRLAVWLLSLRLSPEWRDFVLGDLEEEFVARRHSSPPAAVRWFWWQTIRCVCAPPAPRRHAAGRRLERNHVAYSLPIVIDARLKPGFPEELACDPETDATVTRRWKEYFPAGGVEMGSSHAASLD